jgi:uncharacterized glyoxalase superfamily protein PhnB
MSDAPSPAPAVFPVLQYGALAAAVPWLVRTFGLDEVLVVPGDAGSVRFALLGWRDGIVMCTPAQDPARVGRGIVHLAVDDPDALHERAAAAGAEIVDPPADTDHDSRGYTARDLEGHEWRFDTYRPAYA